MDYSTSRSFYHRMIYAHVLIRICTYVICIYMYTFVRAVCCEVTNILFTLCVYVCIRYIHIYIYVYSEESSDLAPACKSSGAEFLEHPVLDPVQLASDTATRIKLRN